MMQRIANPYYVGLNPILCSKWVGRINGDSVDCKSAAAGTTGSIPVQPTKYRSLMLTVAWRSPKPLVGVRISRDLPKQWKSGRVVDCDSLENCRLERVREFESHLFLQMESWQSGYCNSLLNCHLLIGA